MEMIKWATLIVMFLLNQGLYGQNQSVFFEGKITFIPTVETYVEDSITSDYLIKRIGDTMNYYFAKNGDLRRETITTFYGGLEDALYKKNANLQYIKFNGFDTLYYYDAGVNSAKIIGESDGVGETILNLSTKYIELETIDPDLGKVNIQYFYSSELSINPENYKSFKDGFTDYLFRETNAPFLKLILTYEKFQLTYTAISFKPEPLVDSIFEVQQLPRIKY